MSEKKRAMLTIKGEERKLVFDMGVLADVEEAGYNAQELVEGITKAGSTGQMLYLAWLMLAAGKEQDQRDIDLDELRRLPPYMRMEILAAVLEGVREGFVMESSSDEVRDPVLEEIEKKRDQDA